MKSFYRYIFIFFLSTFQVLTSCQKDDNPPPTDPTPQVNLSHGSLKGANGVCIGSSVKGKYSVDTTLNASHYIDVIVNVSIPGSYTISTDTVNGMFFSAMDVFTTPGTDTVRLKGKGTPLEAGSHILKVRYDETFCTVTVTVQKFYNPLNTLYIGGFDNILYALDATNGSIKWTFITGGYIMSTPTVSKNTVFVGSTDNNLYAIDATTDTMIWKYYTGNYPYDGYIERTPTFNNGTIYFNAANSKVYAVDTTTSIINGIRYPKTKWSAYVGNPGSGSNSPLAVGNGMVYQADRGNYFYALDQSTGVLRWRQFTGGGNFNNPVINNNVVYAFSDNSMLYAFNATTGSVLWQVLAGGGGGRHMSSPTLSNGTVYVGTDYLNFVTNQIWAIDATTGAIKWITRSTEEPGSILSGVVVANGLVYAASENGYVYAWDANTGEPKWKYNTGSTIYGGPTVTSDMMYVANNDGNVLAIQASSGILKWNKKISRSFRYSGVCVVDAVGNVYHPAESGELN